MLLSFWKIMWLQDKHKYAIRTSFSHQFKKLSPKLPTKTYEFWKHIYSRSLIIFLAILKWWSKNQSSFKQSELKSKKLHIYHLQMKMLFLCKCIWVLWCVCTYTKKCKTKFLKQDLAIWNACNLWMLPSESQRSVLSIYQSGQ